MCMNPYFLILKRRKVNVITGYPTGGKEKPPTLRKSTSARSEPLFLYGQTYPKNVETRKKILGCS